MWILMATLCSSLEATSCQTQVYYKEVFLTEQKCNETVVVELPKLMEVFAFVSPLCLYIPLPGQTA